MTTLYAANAHEQFSLQTNSVNGHTSIVPLHSLKTNLSVNYTVNPSNSWRLYADRKNKPGWIIQPYMDHLKGGNLTFAIPLSQIVNMTFLRIEYLRTYENAGVADFIFCEQVLTTLDALWNHHHLYRVSLFEFRTYPVDEFLPICRQECERQKRDFVEIIVSAPSFRPPDEPTPYRRRQLGLSRTGQRRKLLIESSEQRPLQGVSSDRGNGKFKLMGIKICG